MEHLIISSSLRNEIPIPFYDMDTVTGFKKKIQSIYIG